MLRITPSGSADGVKDYFRRGLSRGEYYTRSLSHEQELIGSWGGRGAERLRLSGGVDKDAFDRLCENRHPSKDERLTPRTKDNRRAAYDFNFHVPKSVSVMLELAGDARITEAFRDAVAITMEEMERDTQTRVRIDNQNDSRTTGCMVWAEFTHFTARPVDGVPDPHLHQHCVVFNQTWDSVESRWKAIDVGDIKRDAPYFQAAYHARLAENLRGLGYRIERSHDGWEIAGVPRSVLENFSRRTDEIERAAERLGITDAERKAELGATTRQRKAADLGMEQLRPEWAGRLTAEEQTTLNKVQAMSRHGPQIVPDAERHASLALDHAIKDAFERRSVTEERRLLATALEHGVGRVTPALVRQEFERRVADGEILTGTHERRMFVTTPDVLAEEQKMLATVREGRGTVSPLKTEHAFADHELSEQQRAAVEHVLTTPDTVVAITGRAGVGKTRVMREVVDAIEATGRGVHAAAPTAKAVHDTLQADGFANAKTVAAYLVDPSTPEVIRNQVLWVDEAGLLSAPDMARLIELAHENDTRLILTGDTRQHRSVIRGDALRLLETESGVKPAELSEIRQQHTPLYREAAERLSLGDTERGFDRLEQMGAVHEIADEDRPRKLAEAYVQSIESGQSTLVIAPTHAEGNRVTEAIREELKRSQKLGQTEHTVEKLESLNLTRAEKADPARYRHGDVLIFSQNVSGGFRRGDRAEVIEHEQGDPTLKRDRDGKEAPIPTKAADRFEAYRNSSITLSPGDRVRITHNGKNRDGRHKVYNGADYQLDTVDADGTLTFKNGWKFDKRFGHVDYGYCMTSDAAQGRTVDHVIIAQSSESVGASSRQQFYTSVTRGRHRVSVFTDDKDRLRTSIARDASRMTATELLRSQAGKPPERGLRHRASIGRWLQDRLGLNRKREAVRQTLQRRREHERTRSDNRNREGRSRERSR
ncbi:MAG: MobF family relaxase [Planctomycetota bacterium]